MKVRFSEAARRKVGRIIAEIAACNRFAARRYRKELTAALRLLGQYPLASPVLPERANEGIRHFFVKPYRYFYQIDASTKTVLIVEVWHGAQAQPESRSPAPG